jgi:hypothetical protein
VRERRKLPVIETPSQGEGGGHGSH